MHNFAISIDHFIQVDFCAFRTIVNAIGGVSVPFEHPARRQGHGPRTCPTAGCYNFDGDSGLAYVRSRKYKYGTPVGSGEWHDDGSSDLGRISRQQDFLRRTLSSLLSEGLLRPSVARGLIASATGGDVVTDGAVGGRAAARRRRPAATALVAKGLPPIEPLRSTNRHIAVAGFTQLRTRSRSASNRRPRRQGVCHEDRFQAGVDVEVAAIGPVWLGAILPTPRWRVGPRCATSTKMLPAMCFAKLAQSTVSGADQVGQQRQRFVWTVAHAIGDSRLVEFADLGRDCLELRVASELTPRHRAVTLAARICFRFGVLFYIGRGVGAAPTGAVAFPVRLQHRTRSSQDLGDDHRRQVRRLRPSRRRSRPLSATNAASRPTVGSTVSPPRKPGERAGDGDGVDRATHGGTNSYVGMAACAANEFDDLG